jgi:predicted MFS family arabinose efflux permease
VQGINETLVFLGAGLGSLVAGPVFANGGYEALSVMGVFMVSLLLALIFRNTALRPKIADANAD